MAAVLVQSPLAVPPLLWPHAPASLKRKLPSADSGDTEPQPDGACATACAERAGARAAASGWRCPALTTPRPAGGAHSPFLLPPRARAFQAASRARHRGRGRRRSTRRS